MTCPHTTAIPRLRRQLAPRSVIYDVSATQLKRFLRLSLALQTSIITEGFRSLAEGEPVEFYVESGDDGRTKAVQVTGPAGAPPQVGVGFRLQVSSWFFGFVGVTLALWVLQHLQMLLYRLAQCCTVGLDGIILMDKKLARSICIQVLGTCGKAQRLVSK